jgi:hypothetical protein
MTRVRSALRHKDPTRLHEAAHKLFGTVAGFSTAAGTVAFDIEDHAASGQLEKAATLMQ